MARAHVHAAVSLLTAILLTACSQQKNPTLSVWLRKQPAILRARADVSTAELVGSWNGWARPGLTGFIDQQTSDGTEWIGQSIELPPGHYQYAVLLGDAVLLDETNPQTSFGADPLGHDASPLGTELSDITLTEPGLPAIASVSLTPLGADGLALSIGLQGELAQLSVEIMNGSQLVASPQLTVSAGTASAQLLSLPPGKYTARVQAKDVEAKSASAFVEAQPGRALGDGLVYQVMVDRFRGPGALAAPASPGDRAGGTLAGVTEALEAGYFARLGVTTLWLSPVYQNPDGRYQGLDGHPYEAYHGYWPSEPRTVDSHLGGEAALDELIAEAHARGLRVILDAVPNHVFEQHPYYLAHGFAEVGAQSWFNDGPAECVCGSPACGWDTAMETCWFTSYMPDLNWRRPEVLDQGSSDLAWWMQRFDLDGLRIDAVPMMPRAATRRIDRAVRAAVSRSGLDGLLLGEVYTGPGQDAREQIREYLAPALDGLDAAFDFPAMWSMRDVIAHGTSGFDALENEVSEGETTWDGSGSTLARIIGNHDTTRFISEANGDAGADAWSGGAQQPALAEPYQRQRLALAFILTLPGLPVLYYGDEVGLAGAGDPDSRRVLPDVLGTLSANQAQLLEDVSRMARARAGLPALRRGARRLAFVCSDYEVAVRDEPAEGGGAAIVALSRSRDDASQTVVGLPDGSYQDVLSSRTLEVSGGTANLSLPALSAALFVRQGSPCLQ